MKTNLKLDWCSHEAAKYAVINWHYSKAMPSGKLVKIGVWEDEKFIGVVLFGRGASPHIGKKYNLSNIEICELVRVALDEHHTPVSKIIKIALIFLKKNSKGLRLVVSFADTNMGHHGGIYQAGNWIYTGKSNMSKQFKDKRGKVWHQRQVTETGFVKEFGQYKRCLKIEDCSEILLMGKHRYLMPLDKAMKKQIEHLAKPYPSKAVNKQSISELCSAIRTKLSPDLLKKEYRIENKLNPMFGHCYVATETVYYLIRKLELVEYFKFKPCHGKDTDGITHWWLQNGTDKLDLTEEQYTSIGKVPPYNNGRNGSFLTRVPSKRSKILMDRVMNKLRLKHSGDVSCFQQEKGGSIPT